MGHPLYLRGGVCKPLDMRQIGMTDLTLPLREREYPEGGEGV